MLCSLHSPGHQNLASQHKVLLGCMLSFMAGGALGRPCWPPSAELPSREVPEYFAHGSPSPPPSWHCRPALKFLLGLHAEFQGRGCAGRARASRCNFTGSQQTYGDTPHDWGCAKKIFPESSVYLGCCIPNLDTLDILCRSAPLNRVGKKKRQHGPQLCASQKSAHAIAAGTQLPG
eukprot:scaffold61169_cov17-Tisochrysis_lutea.AAC.2